MNWYRFNIELTAWAVKVALCVLTTLVVLRTLIAKGEHSYPLGMRSAADHEWLIRSVFLLLIVALWALYLKIFHMYRSRKAYGER